LVAIQSGADQLRHSAAPLASPLFTNGWSGNGTHQQVATMIAMIEFCRHNGTYDFTDQWMVGAVVGYGRSPIAK
jgi:hypothetical protein